MGAQCSQFVRNITRIKSEDNSDGDDIDFLKQSRDLPLTKSIQHLLAVCFNCAVFVVVGMAVKSIAGPAMVLAILLGALVAMMNNLSLSELCTRSPTSTSFYSIIYANVGELCAFMIGWFRVLQNIFMIAIVSFAAGEYIKYLAEPALGHVWAPNNAGWTDVKLDALVFIVAFLVLLSIIVAAGLPSVSVYLVALCWISVAVFVFMFILILYHANNINWIRPTEFQPFNYGGTIQGVAITMFFFTSLDKVVEQSMYMKRPNTRIPVSLSISLLIVLTYYLCSTLFVTILVPIEYLNETATIPKVFARTTIHSSKYILSSAAIIIFCLTIFESYFGAQKLLNLLAQDGLLRPNFANRQNPKKVPALSVSIIALLSIPLFLWLPIEHMVQGYCVVSLIISIIINCSTIVVQYRPEYYNIEPNSRIFPNWGSTKTLVKRFLLCFGYISHKSVLSRCGLTKDLEPSPETSKIVNWSIITYVPSCVCLASAMFHGLPVIGWKRWIVLAALGLLLISLFVTIRVILIQPRKKAHFFQSDFLASFIPLFNIALLAILMISLEWMSFCAVGVWFGLGLVIYFVYGIFHSHEAFQSFEELHKTETKGGVQFDRGPELITDLTSVQPKNTDVDSDQFLFADDTMHYDFPQK